MNEIIVAPNQVATIHDVAIVLPSAIAIRDDLLATSSNVEQVVNADSQAMAIDLIGRINGILKQVESGRKAIKEPFTRKGKEIDGMANTYSGPLENEKNRLSGLVTRFQAAEQQKAWEAEQKRKAELDEIARVQADLDRAARAGAISQAAAAEAQNTLNVASAKTLVVTVEPPKAQGVRNIRKFRVTDIAALYRARPDLVELSPRTAMINKVIEIPETIPQIPGIEVYEEIKVQVRAK
jgi:hypothetical protein